MQNLTRTRIERILLLDRELSANRHPNCSSFAKLIQETWGYDKAPDRRTILRDIEFLRSHLNAPIEWSPEHNGYHYTVPTWQMPSFLSISEMEMLNLLLAWRLALVLDKVPVAENLAKLFDKLAATVTMRNEALPMDIRSKFSFHSAPVMPVDREIWTALFKAVMGNRRVSIYYQSTTDQKPHRRLLSPYHMANIAGEWYVTGFCHLREGWRNFALSRISKVEETTETFESPAPFDPEAYYSNRFGRFLSSPESKPYKVVLRFGPEAKKWLYERVWHAKQKIRKARDGRFILTLPMPSLFEARRWVMSWGKAAEVLEPAELRWSMAEEVAAMSAIYDGSGTRR